MNVFEFLLVIVSIVLGLGITELLAGFVRILRGELVAGKLHALWMFVILQLQVQLAWGLWGLRSKAEWQYPHLIRRRRPLFLLLAGYVFVTGLFSWFLFDEDLTLTSAIIRLPAVAILVALATTERRHLHLVLGLVILALQLWFTYLFTFVVGAAQTAA